MLMIPRRNDGCVGRPAAGRDAAAAVAATIQMESKETAESERGDDPRILNYSGCTIVHRVP